MKTHHTAVPAEGRLRGQPQGQTLASRMPFNQPNVLVARQALNRKVATAKGAVSPLEPRGRARVALPSASLPQTRRAR